MILGGLISLLIKSLPKPTRFPDDRCIAEDSVVGVFGEGHTSTLNARVELGALNEKAEALD